MSVRMIGSWLLVVGFPFLLKAQPIQLQDSAHSLKEFCIKGHVHGHLRNYFMATTNKGDLSDYWTNATGGALGYESAIWKGFQFGIKGIYTYQSFSSDLNSIDSLAGKSAFWEKQLYDTYRPEETRSLGRWDELFLRYHFGKKGYVAVGKLDINEGPLFLRWDGRMNTYAYSGLWSSYKLSEQQRFTGGWIQGVSPRGMTKWFSISEAIGLKANGFQPDGTPANYHEAAPSRGIGVLSYHFSPRRKLKLQVWNYYFDKLTNISWAQVDVNHGKLLGGIQFVHQRALPYQATLPYAKRYYQPDEQANVLNLLAGYKWGHVKLSAAYFHAFRTGRFLFPKELGLENFYVFQPRNTMEGLGNTDAYMLRMELHPQAEKWKNLSADFRFRVTQTPGADQPQFNKYKIFSRFHTSSTLRYRFDNIFEGLEFLMLHVYAFSPDVKSLTPSQVFYKSHFHHLNFVVNMKF